MDQKLQLPSEPLKSSPLTNIDVKRKSRMSMGFMLLIQFRAVLVLECQPSGGPPIPSWIQPYNSPHMAGIGFKKIGNSLPAWQAALASISSPSHPHLVKIDGSQYQDVSSVGHIDLCYAIYAEICEDTGRRGKPIAVSIGSKISERPNAKGSRTKDIENPELAAYASDRHNKDMSRLLYEDPHCYYRFENSEYIHDRPSRSIGKIKALRQSITRKLPKSIKHIPDVLRGFNFKEQVGTSNDESNRTASSKDVSTKDDHGGSAKLHKTLKYITKSTEAYLLRDDVQTRIFECALTLVEHRRRWAQVDLARWKREYRGVR